MIIEELQELRNFITQKCVVSCEIGQRDRSPDTYPIIELLPTGTIPVFDTSNPVLRYIGDMQVNVRIITDKLDEIGALNIFERLCLNVGEFNRQKGHSMTSEFQGEYDDSRFIISGAINLKFRIHNSE